MSMLRRWADKRLSNRCADLESALANQAALLDAAKRALEVQISEAKILAAVVARNHARVLAETAVETQRRARAEGSQHDRTI
jgi:hypothetical protein